MTEEHKQLYDLYRIKGELTTQIEIHQFKLKQVNDLIAGILARIDEKAKEEQKEK